MIGKEDVQLSTKQMDELIELMDKEEVLEVEEQIQKALKKLGTEAKQAEEEQDPTGSTQAKDEASSTPESSQVGSNDATIQAAETRSTKAEAKPDNKTSEDRSKSAQATNVLKPTSSDVVRDPVASVTSGVPPPPKKAEGSKQL